ncbi:MAG: glycolate oxidase subunit GlcF [Betaproteobacteria bacterium]|nr:glycolate oxidase subunit GlcF [Betaproteobacteria bacterium]
MTNAVIAGERLAHPGAEYASASLGQCQHCGFCTLHCPTFLLLRDERDSPRGRVRFAAEILETGRPPTPEAVRHMDRCLSCLGCSSACPFGVDHQRLWDESRAAIERAGVRSLRERLWRQALARLLVSPNWFRLMLGAAPLGRALRPLLPAQLRRMLDVAPVRRSPPRIAGARVYPAIGERRMRVALLAGCVQQVLGAAVDDATVNLLTRHGCEVVVAEGSGCCGAVPLHLGMPERAARLAAANVEAWERITANGGLDAVVVNASGCGTTVKDYGAMLSDEPRWADAAGRIAAMTRDLTELVAELPVTYNNPAEGMTIALHTPCSLQHGQGITRSPQRLLRSAGFVVREAPDAHLCCGSAGTYSLLQPEIADKLGANKAGALEIAGGDVVATGNIACLLHIARFTAKPVVHTVELLDWASGGTRPAALDSVSG